MRGFGPRFGLLSTVGAVFVAIGARVARRGARRSPPSAVPPAGSPAAASSGAGRAVAGSESAGHASGGRAASIPAGVPLVVSLVSLGLSGFAVFVDNRDPEVLLTAPAWVRVAQGPNDAWLYVQPRFVSTGRNDRVEVITDITLRVEPLNGGQASDFVWDEQGQWNPDPITNGMSWVFTGDPEPMVVSPTSPRLPFGLFVGPGWAWEAGAYRVTITAEREIAGSPLRASFEMSLALEQVDLIGKPRGGSWVQIVARPT